MDEFIKKLIERLEEEKEHYGTLVVVGVDDLVLNYNLGKMHSFEDAIEIINELAEEYINCSTDTSTDCSTNNGWIDCTERLPESDYMCLVTVEYPSGKIAVNYGWFDKVGVCWYLGMYEFRTTNVHAWQPLPEPYKPKEQPDSISEAWKQRTMSRFERVE